MKNIVRLAILLLLVVHSLNAQEVQWTDPEKSGGSLSYILPMGGGNFYATKTVGRGLFGTYQLAHYENFHITAKEKVPVKVPTGTGTIERILVQKGHPFVFISDKDAELNHLYLQECDEQISPIGEARLISEIANPKGRKSGGEFSVLVSNNNKYIVVLSTVTDAKNDGKDVGYKILDAENDFSVVNTGQYEVRLDEETKEIITNQYISNTGDYFQVIDGVSNNRKATVQNRTLRLLTEGGVEDMSLELPDNRYISNMVFSSDNKDMITITGSYGQNSNGMAGVFYLQVDFKKKAIVKEGFSAFDPDFITQGWSDRAKKKAEKKAAAGKGTPELYSYEMRDNVTLEDGSIIGLMEQYYVHVVTTYTQNGGYTSTYYYYYNDIIAYKISYEGEFEWVKKVPKYQVSTNDGGRYSSFCSYVSDGQLSIIFNDVGSNYEEDGSYIEPVKGSGKSARVSKRKNAVAKVDIDLASGETNRKIFFRREELNAIAVPKKFNVDYNNREVLIYLITGKKEKFGLMKI